jgi:hypothetical protein
MDLQWFSYFSKHGFNSRLYGMEKTCKGMGIGWLEIYSNHKQDEHEL